jgi:Na+/proline symporter
MSTRKETFACLVFFYGLAILYLLFELRGTYKSKRHKSFGEFIKSRQLFMSLVSIFSMIAGIVACSLHYSAWMCFGGEGKDCVNGPSQKAFDLISEYFPMDAVSNIGFIASKILVLQKCLRIVQMGLDKSPEAPSDRLLSVVVGLLCVSFLGCFAFAIVARVIDQQQSDVIGQLRNNAQSKPTFPDFPVALSGFFSSAAVMFALATLSSLLYVWHTTFHLSRYLKSLQKDTKERRLSEDEEPTDTTALSAFARIKNFASKMSPIQQTVKTLRGNLRRLQLSVALIALSFLFKVFLYVTLAVGYISRDPAPPHNTTMTNPPYIDRHLCFPTSCA